MKSLKFKINTAMNNLVQGQIITLQCDDEGSPLEKFWRRRLKDSETDNCMEAYTEAEEKPKKSKTTITDKSKTDDSEMASPTASGEDK